MPDPAAVAGAFPLEASLVATSGAGEVSPRSLLATRVVRGPWEASLELEASPKRGGPAVAPAPVPNAGTAACTLGASLTLEGVRAAGSGDSNDPARTGVSSVVSAAALRVPSWLGGSEDAWATMSFPTVASLPAGGGGIAAPVGVISPAGIGSASVAAAGLEIASAGVSGRAGSSAPASLAAGSNRGEWRSSSTRPKSLPVSSLRALLLHERSGADITASPEAGAGGGCVTRSMERGDLQKKRPAIESIRAAAANNDKKH
jgi:hypothetical protein